MRRGILLPFVAGLLLLATLSAQGEPFDARAEKARDLFNQGVSHLFNRNYEAATDRLFKSLGVRPQDNRVRYFLGLSLYQSGYTEAALEQWRLIQKLGGQDALLEQKIAQALNRPTTPKSAPLLVDYAPLRVVPSMPLTNGSIRLFPSSATVDDQDRVVFTDFKSGGVGRIGANGDRLEWILDGLLSKIPLLERVVKPMEILAAGKSGWLVSDFGQDRVVTLGPDGKILASFGGHGTSNGRFLGPSGLAWGPDGQVFVADTGNCRIQVFNKDGQFLFAFGRRGSAPGELMLPAGLASDRKAQRLYVADRGNNRVSVYDFSGAYLSSFGESFLLKPRKILTDTLDKGVLTLVDSANVWLYRPADDMMRSLFYSIHDDESRDVEPLSAAYGKSGLLYVGDAKGANLAVFSPLALRYVNLDVTVQGILLREFPKVVLQVSVRGRDGKILPGLEKKNFEVIENRVAKDFEISSLPESARELRLTLMVDRSAAAREREPLLRSMLQDFLGDMSPREQASVMLLGGGKADGSGTFTEAAPLNNSVLKNIETALAGEWHSSIRVGTALKKAIGDNLGIANRKAIVIFAFSEIDEDRFKPESLATVSDFALRNDVPVHVIWGGAAERKATGDGRKAGGAQGAAWKALADRTGGRFHLYENRGTTARLLGDLRQRPSGTLLLAYPSVRDDFKAGQFRSVEVRVNYQGMNGLDNRSGYPIP